MASDQRVSLAHSSISISIFNQRYFATFSVAAFQLIVSAPLSQGLFQTFFRAFEAFFSPKRCAATTLLQHPVTRMFQHSARNAPSFSTSRSTASNPPYRADEHANHLFNRKEPLILPFSGLSFATRHRQCPLSESNREPTD